MATSSSGGYALRELRKLRKLNLDDVAGQAEIAFKTVQEIETGITKQPSYPVVEKILDAITELSPENPPTPAQKQNIMHYFGYRISFPKPTSKEVQSAVERWRKDNFDVPYPAYLVDCSQKVLDWNIFAPRLLGLTYSHPATQFYKQATVYDLAFNLSVRRGFHFDKAEEYLASLVSLMKYEFEPFSEEDWCVETLNKAKKEYPEFAQMWDNTVVSLVNEVSYRTMKPLHIVNPNDGSILKFRLMGADFVNDPRFRSVQYLPLDTLTMQHCLLWAEQERHEQQGK